jgi:hypothetical protein
MEIWFTALPFFHFLDFKKNEVYHVARFEKESRYYILRLEKDLLNDWTITAINGRIRSKLGQSRTLAFPTFTDAFSSFCEMAKLRYQRKYHLKIIACDTPLFLYLLPFLVNVEEPVSKTSSKAKTKTKAQSFNPSSSVNLHQPIHQQMDFWF